MIDKVVRMRGRKGRFGVDHSEILNYEFELANKERTDHMNRLVYKNNYLPTYSDTGFYNNTDCSNENIMSGGHLSSTVLFQRLNQKEMEETNKQHETLSKSSKTQRS